MPPESPPAPGPTGDTARRRAAVQPASGEARIRAENIPGRAGPVAGLRSLADYLAANPAVPVPDGCQIAVYAEGADSEQSAQAGLVAEIVGEQPAGRKAISGHHHVQRSSGPVTYEFRAIAQRQMARLTAGMSYADSVVPDTPAEPPARLAAEAFPALADAAAIAAAPAPAAGSPPAPPAGQRRGVMP